MRDGGLMAQAVVSVEAAGEYEVDLVLEKLPQRPVAGLRFRPGEDGAEVTWIHPDGPAAGRLLVGDLIVSINGESLLGLGVKQAGPMMAGGAVGVPLTYSVLRDGVPRSVEIVPVGGVDLTRGDRSDDEPGTGDR